MPELPEVEVTRRGLAPHLVGQRIAAAIVRHAGLRHPVPENLRRILPGLVVRAITRRGKYLLLDCGVGWLILHLGMSGSLRIVPAATPAEKHDHFDLVLESGNCMRLRDPRRFGAVLWTTAPDTHPLLAKLGVEPLDAAFDGDFLHRATRGRRTAVKPLLMDSHVVVGIGNIYACESLYHAGIDPRSAADSISLRRYRRLVTAIRRTLEAAIAAGGSSLRDFVHADGSPGHFQQAYCVYGRADESCRRCGSRVKSLRQAGRASFYCPRCQR